MMLAEYKRKKIQTPYWQERMQWYSTAKCLQLLSNEYCMKIHRYIRDIENLKISAPPDIAWFQNLKIRFTRYIHEFESSAPAVRIKMLKIPIHTRNANCMYCNGYGFVGDKTCWCMRCEGWGKTGAKEHFRYLRDDSPPGIVVYKLRNGAVVDYFTVGTKVTVDIL